MPAERLQRDEVRVQRPPASGVELSFGLCVELSFALCMEGSREPPTAVEQNLAELTDIFE